MPITGWPWLVLVQVELFLLQCLFLPSWPVPTLVSLFSFGILGNTDTSTHVGFTDAFVGWICVADGFLLFELVARVVLMEEDGVSLVALTRLPPWTPLDGVSLLGHCGCRLEWPPGGKSANGGEWTLDAVEEVSEGTWVELEGLLMELWEDPGRSPSPVIGDICGFNWMPKSPEGPLMLPPGFEGTVDRSQW